MKCEATQLFIFQIFALPLGTKNIDNDLVTVFKIWTMPTCPATQSSLNLYIELRSATSPNTRHTAEYSKFRPMLRRIAQQYLLPDDLWYSPHNNLTT